MQKTNSGPEAKAAVEEMEALKKRAARQAAKRELAPEEVQWVECVVLPLGDGKISMGQHIGGLGTVHYEEGETFRCELRNAVSLYVKGFVNFDGAKAALEEFKASKEQLDAAERIAKAAQDRALQAAGL